MRKRGRRPPFPHPAAASWGFRPRRLFKDGRDDRGDHKQDAIIRELGHLDVWTVSEAVFEGCGVHRSAARSRCARRSYTPA